MENKFYVLQWELLTVKRKINSQIRNLPDNPNIKRIGSNCFSISSSELPKNNFNMSPRFYDFKFQYEKIVEKLKLINPFALYNFLNKIIEEKKFRLENETILLNPKVIDYLKSLI